ncbi:MAG: HEPN domain-containing protein [Spartobacteria bacterium]
MKTDENNPEDWYRSASARLGSVDRLYPLEGASESVIELLQESVERLLKGYLISKGWPLAKIHDLGALIAEAENYDDRFAAFADFADELTDQFWAMHYPGGEFDQQTVDFEELRAKVDQMIRLIK